MHLGHFLQLHVCDADLLGVEAHLHGLWEGVLGVGGLC